jgi:hypothetical protein
MEKIKLWEILVPTHFNNGEEIPVEHHQEWDEYVKSLAGGLTIMKKGRGVWVSGGGTTFKENMTPVRIACKGEQAREIAVFTARHYRQEAVMYYLLSREVYIYKPDSSLA